MPLKSSRQDTKFQHILLVGDAAQAEGPEEWKQRGDRISSVEDIAASLETIKQSDVDLVIISPDDLLALSDSTLCHHGSSTIDSVNQGICIVGENDTVLWANPKLLAFPEEVRDRVLSFCRTTLDWTGQASSKGTKQLRGRRFSFEVNGFGAFELTVTPLIDPEKRVTRVVAVVWDVTKSRGLQQKIDAIDRLGRELVSLDPDQLPRLDVQERLALLEQKVLCCTRDILHFDTFEVRVLDRSSNRLEIVLTSGISQNDTEIYASSEGNGICGYVAARGQSYICPDTSADPRYVPGLEEARSSLTVPLLLQDRVVGVANFESTQPAAFHEDDRQFAEIFARYVAQALNILQLLVSERQTTTGRLGNDMMTEITSPLNDILTETENLVEDYIGHDDLRKRLRRISEDAVQIRETIRGMTTLEAGVMGVHKTKQPHYDPLLVGKNILVADDEPVIRETVRDVLTSCGCNVSEASDGAIAVELITQKPFDLVLSDIKMPHKTGYDVFAAAKKANPDTPVILSTGFGYDPNHSVIRARREGLSAVLFKPFKVDQLLDEIRSVLQLVGKTH